MRHLDRTRDVLATTEPVKVWDADLYQKEELVSGRRKTRSLERDMVYIET